MNYSQNYIYAYDQIKYEMRDIFVSQTIFYKMGSIRMSLTTHYVFQLPDHTYLIHKSFPHCHKLYYTCTLKIMSFLLIMMFIVDKYYLVKHNIFKSCMKYSIMKYLSVRLIYFYKHPGRS